VQSLPLKASQITEPSLPEPCATPAIGWFTKQEQHMKLPAKLFIGAAFLALASCGGKGDDKAAEKVEQAFENKADALDDAAENATGAAEERLEDEAEVYRRQGKPLPKRSTMST
jgi:hypothetical protein